MLTYFVKRLLAGLGCLIAVSILIFAAIRFAGDPTEMMLPEDASQAERAHLRAELGLDAPLPVQYLVFAKEALHGQFGMSTRWRRPAFALVMDRLPATLELAGVAFVISLAVGLLCGVTSAHLRGTPFDGVVRFASTLGLAVPAFWLGLMLVLVFAVNWGWLPTSGRGGLVYLILPAITMAMNPAAALSRLSRSAMLTVLNADYIKMARVKGNPESMVLWKHGLKNAAIPVTTMAGMQLAAMIGNAVVVESIFAWPGIGKLVIDAIYARDLALVQVGICVISAVYIVLNLLVDMCYGLLDPRISYA